MVVVVGDPCSETESNLPPLVVLKPPFGLRVRLVCCSSCAALASLGGLRIPPRGTEAGATCCPALLLPLLLLP